MKLKLYIILKNNAFHNYQLAKVTRAKIELSHTPKQSKRSGHAYLKKGLENRSQRIQLFWQCTTQETNDELYDNIKQSLTCVLAYLMQKYHDNLHVNQFLTNA